MFYKIFIFLKTLDVYLKYSKQLGTPLKLSSDFVSPICVGEAIPSVNCISLDLQTSKYSKLQRIQHLHQV